MRDALDIVTLVAALGCGLAAGVFFAFSAFVMDGLARATPAAGIAAMQGINRRAPAPAFLLAWLGTALVCFVAAVWTAVAGGERRTILVVAAALLYVAGTVVVTFRRNVPMNDRLDALDPSDAEAARYWRVYVRDWTRCNHVRAATGLAAAALLTVALAAD
jgi:uncharacterized membrane protein